MGLKQKWAEPAHKKTEGFNRIRVGLKHGPLNIFPIFTLSFNRIRVGLKQDYEMYYTENPNGFNRIRVGLKPF